MNPHQIAGDGWSLTTPPFPPTVSHGHARLALPVAGAIRNDATTAPTSLAPEATPGLAASSLPRFPALAGVALSAGQGEPGGRVAHVPSATPSHTTNETAAVCPATVS